MDAYSSPPTSFMGVDVDMLEGFFASAVDIIGCTVGGLLGVF